MGCVPRQSSPSPFPHNRKPQGVLAYSFGNWWFMGGRDQLTGGTCRNSDQRRRLSSSITLSKKPCGQSENSKPMFACCAFGSKGRFVHVCLIGIGISRCPSHILGATNLTLPLGRSLTSLVCILRGRSNKGTNYRTTAGAQAFLSLRYNFWRRLQAPDAEIRLNSASNSATTRPITIRFDATLCQQPLMICQTRSETSWWSGRDSPDPLNDDRAGAVPPGPGGGVRPVKTCPE